MISLFKLDYYCQTQEIHIMISSLQHHSSVINSHDIEVIHHLPPHDTYSYKIEGIWTTNESKMINCLKAIFCNCLQSWLNAIKSACLKRSLTLRPPRSNPSVTVGLCGAPTACQFLLMHSANNCFLSWPFSQADRGHCSRIAGDHNRKILLSKLYWLILKLYVCPKSSMLDTIPFQWP